MDDMIKTPISNKKILALDIATHCGFAYCDGQNVTSGTWDLSVRRDESGGMRFIRMASKLNEIFSAGIDLLVFEAARHAAPKMQGALVVQAQFQGVVLLWAEQHKIDYKGYSPSEIKKFATGKGNAKKEDMINAAKTKLNITCKDDNEADALWLLHYAIADYGK